MIARMTCRPARASIGRLAALALAGLLVTGLSVWGQDPKPSEDELKKARAEVKNLQGDLEKLYTQAQETYRKLGDAQQKLDKLEGRLGDSGRGRFPWGGSRDWRGRMDPRPQPPREAPKPPDTGKAGDLEQKLDLLMKELEQLRKEIRKAPPK